jgi:alkylhydroperoxidase family enzyme
MSRITPLEAPFSPEIQKQFDTIMPPGVDPLILFRTVATSERAWSKFRGGSLLDRGPLSLREREIAIDRTCARAGCEYEWGVHITFFAEKAGFDDAQIRATVLEGSDASCWTEEEQVLIAAIDALHERATLSDSEHSILLRYYSDDQILEIIQVCGFYRMVSYMANALKLPLEPFAKRFPVN